MMKFTFEKGEGERTFIAAGMHSQGLTYMEYKVSGHWSPEPREGKIPVEMKITYGPVFVSNTELKGVFDLEEDSLRGTAVWPFNGFTGEFVFKRDPDFVRFYPAPSVTDAQVRWKFVTTAVLDRIRQHGWSRERILGRIKDGKRFRELSFKDNCGGNFTGEEFDCSNAIFSSLDEADIQFHSSLVNIGSSKTILFT